MILLSPILFRRVEILWWKLVGVAVTVSRDVCGRGSYCLSVGAAVGMAVTTGTVVPCGLLWISFYIGK